MRRVSVVGNSGSGKTTLARRIADVLGVPLTELDAVHHLPDWEPIDPADFQAEVTRRAAGDAWVIDGNYRSVVVDGPVWQRADTVIWLDLPRRTVMRQVTTRTVRRLVTREELWNGNREPLRNITRWDPEESIIRWAWTNHHTYRERYGTAMTEPDLGHLSWVRLRSRADVDAWLATLAPPSGEATS